MNNDNNESAQSSVLCPLNYKFADMPEDFDDTGDYLGFISNGMTNNEKIDEYNYYDNYLD